MSGLWYTCVKLIKLYTDLYICQTYQTVHLIQRYFIEYKLYPYKIDLKCLLRDQVCILNECLSKTSEEQGSVKRSTLSGAVVCIIPIPLYPMN